MTTTKKSTFDQLYAVDVSGKTEKKNGLTYLSWASAWAEAKKICPSINYKIYEEVMGVTPDGEPRTVNYFHDNKTAYVKVGVTVGEQEHIEHLPIMDFKHKSIPLDKVTSWDVASTIKRCLTKALAMHGLGLRIYEGDDLPIKEVTTTFTLPANGNGKKLIALKVGDDNWEKKVEPYVIGNQQLGLDVLIKNLTVKYKITAPVKAALKKLIL